MSSQLEDAHPDPPCAHGLTGGRGADERCLECGAAVSDPRPENPMSIDTNLSRGLFHLLNGETAHGLTIIQHDDEPPKATPTYMLNLNVGWADHIIAERMYLSDARGIAYLLAASLNCPVGDVEEPSRA